MLKKGIIFDLDGTLWDTITQIVPAWNRALEKHGTGCVLTEEAAMGMMGKTASEIAEMLMPQIPKADRDNILQECCLEEYDVLRKIGGTLYPDLLNVLIRLHEKYFLAIVSNCLDGYIQTFLKYHQFENIFDDTECAGCTGKSKGENIKLVVERNNLERAIYVGDTEGDFSSARFANVPFVHAEYGFGTAEGAEYKINRFCEIEKLAEKLLD